VNGFLNLFETRIKCKWVLSASSFKITSHSITFTPVINLLNAPATVTSTSVRIGCAHYVTTSTQKKIKLSIKLKVFMN